VASAVSITVPVGEGRGLGSLGGRLPGVTEGASAGTVAVAPAEAGVDGAPLSHEANRSAESMIRRIAAMR
jgi:hypothetical protein